MKTTQLGLNLWPVQQEVVKSKCKNLCKPDSTQKYCTGCLRTLEEIEEYGRNKNKDATDSK
jgi:predicted Fe-S protein YdhL (DUF1289 family)